MEKSQIDLLAEFIMAEVPGEPSKSEGAGECAIRIIRQLTAERDAARADEADTLATKDAYHMVLSAANTQIGTLTAERDAARQAIAKLWPAFPFGSTYTLNDDDKCAISSALAGRLRPEMLGCETVQEQGEMLVREIRSA